MRFPISIRRPVGAGEHDRVAIGIAQPDFPMVRAAFVIGRISMTRQDNLHPQLCRPRNGGVKIISLKPEQDAVPMRQLGITDATMMMIFLPAVQLKNQFAVRGSEPFILRAAVGASATKQTLIPAAARLDIAYAN